MAKYPKVPTVNSGKPPIQGKRKSNKQYFMVWLKVSEPKNTLTFFSAEDRQNGWNTPVVVFCILND